MEDSQPNRYEVSHSPTAPAVASKEYLLSEILDRLAALEEEVAELREENRQKGERIAALEKDHNEVVDFNARERALDRQRIKALETPAPVLSQKTAEDHIDKLFSEMRRLNIRQTTTKDAAHLLGVSKPLMKKIKPYLSDDSRFVVVKDPHHKQRHLIRLSVM